MLITHHSVKQEQLPVTLQFVEWNKSDWETDEQPQQNQPNEEQLMIPTGGKVKTRISIKNVRLFQVPFIPSKFKYFCRTPMWMKIEMEPPVERESKIFQRPKDTPGYALICRENRDYSICNGIFKCDQNFKSNFLKISFCYF